MSIYQLKPRFQSLLRPITYRLYQLGITANQVTLLAMLLSILLGFGLHPLTSTHPIWWFVLPLWLLIRMALNAIDGMLAREYNQRSRLGALLNEMGDVLSDTALFIPFLLAAPSQGLWIGLVMLLSLLSEFAGVLAIMIGAQRNYAGPLGKSDRAALLSGAAMLLGLSVLNPQQLPGLWAVMAILLVITTLHRLYQALNTAEVTV